MWGTDDVVVKAKPQASTTPRDSATWCDAHCAMQVGREQPLLRNMTNKHTRDVGKSQQHSDCSALPAHDSLVASKTQTSHFTESDEEAYWP